MRLELASAGLRRERGTAMRRALNELAERLIPLTPSDKRLARSRPPTRHPGCIHTEKCAS